MSQLFIRSNISYFCKKVFLNFTSASTEPILAPTLLICKCVWGHCSDPVFSCLTVPSTYEIMLATMEIMWLIDGKISRYHKLLWLSVGVVNADAQVFLNSQINGLLGLNTHQYFIIIIFFYKKRGLVFNLLRTEEKSHFVPPQRQTSPLFTK